MKTLMFRVALAGAAGLTFALVPAAPARAAILTEGAFGAGTRVSNNYVSPSPTYSLSTGALVAGVDTRGSGTFNDIGLKFALGSALPPGSVITSAVLTVNVASTQVTVGSASTTTLTVSGAAGNSAALSLADFGTATGNVGSTVLPIVTTGPPPTFPPVTFDVTALLQSFLALGSSSAFFQFDDPVFNTNVLLYGATDPTASNRPSLTITYSAVPEPASAALATLGLGLALGAARGAARRP